MNQKIWSPSSLRHQAPQMIYSTQTINYRCPSSLYPKEWGAISSNSKSSVILISVSAQNDSFWTFFATLILTSTCMTQNIISEWSLRGRGQIGCNLNYSNLWKNQAKGKMIACFCCGHCGPLKSHSNCQWKMEISLHCWRRWRNSGVL